MSSTPDPWTGHRQGHLPELAEFPPDLTFPNGRGGGVAVEPLSPLPPAPPPPLARRRISGRLVLIAVVFALASTGAGIAVRNFLKDVSEAADIAKRTSVVTPETLAGLPKAAEPADRAVADKLRAEAGDQEITEGATSIATDAYGSRTGKDLVWMFAYAKLHSDPADYLDAYLNSTTGIEVVDYVALDAGPLGGFAKCGDVGSNLPIPSIVCAWADHGSFGTVVYFDQPMTEQIQQRFLAARQQIEQRAPAR